jgi:hypothetical protein
MQTKGTGRFLHYICGFRQRYFKDKRQGVLNRKIGFIFIFVLQTLTYIALRITAGVQNLLKKHCHLLKQTTRTTFR